MNEALKILKHRKSEADVFDSLDDICNINKMYQYCNFHIEYEK